MKKLGIAAGLTAALAAAAWFYRDSTPVLYARLVWASRSSAPVSAVGPAMRAYREGAVRIDRAADQMRVLASEPGREFVETAGERWWIPARNREALAERLDDRLRSVYGDAAFGVRPGDVVLDCGANVGVFTRYALGRGAARVIAVEPAPENLACLRHNLADEIAAGFVVVVDRGVWDRDESRVLRTFDEQSGGDSVALRFPGSHEGPKVPLTTINALAAELKIDRLDFVKMDIEGAEPRALAGAQATFARFHPRLAVSVEHRPEDLTLIPSTIRRLWPEYAVRPGPLARVETALLDRVQPEVVFAAPAAR